MSLLSARRNTGNHRQNEDLIQHRRKVLELKTITRVLAKNQSLNDLINSYSHHDVNNSPSPDSEEATWLKSIDLASGHTFDEASISVPTITTTNGTRLSSPSPASAGLGQKALDAHAPDSKATEASLADSTPQIDRKARGDLPKRSRAASEDVEGSSGIATHALRGSVDPDGPVALPDKIAPPEPAEEATFDDPTNELLNLESPERPAKVVHLPPKGGSVDENGVEDGRRRSDVSGPIKVSHAHPHAQGEGASSPSSTVGAYSTATPLPPQESPDTSPDSENAEPLEEVLPPKDLRPSPEEQKQKEEHDRLLEAQKELARKQALGDVSETPDDQLRWEEREAAARNAEEQAAREDVAGPEASGNLATKQSEAERVVDDVMKDRDVDPSEQDESIPQADSATQEQPRAAPLPISEEDGDNITVTPRNRASLTVDTGRLPASTEAAATKSTSEEDRTTSRTVSGALHQRTVSGILSQTPAQEGHHRRSVVLSPDEMLRDPHNTLTGPSTTYETPRKPTRRPDSPRTPPHRQSAIEDLMALKGAAQDPERDYLEPLFRIQAHDASNVRTTSLTELVRSSSKTLSTEDQVLTAQERLDYKILRRIYQLQNANKWSLRQMERSKEPEQPVSHHDQMMSEMKWMRKDFKQERKMKKSVCAWLAGTCAAYIAAPAEEQKAMQGKFRLQKPKATVTAENEEQLPELEPSGDSAAEEEAGPPTPTIHPTFHTTLVVPPELSGMVNDLQKAGKLQKALKALPTTGLTADLKPQQQHQQDSRILSLTSKFVQGKVLPQQQGPSRKRSRFEYDDDDAAITGGQRDMKRLRHDEDDLPPDDQDSALFHPDNKHIRDRLHANNAFRPPSEFPMPSIAFYEYRNGSQWIWEDDQKLKKLAKEYSFNWSLIADELQLPGYIKSSMERRTPWECFERWVELEQLPTEMKKTLYFKTWYQRLEQSQQAAERRYQAQVAAMQAQQTAQAGHVPPRKKTIPHRVEKRRNTRYLWLVDAMRKGARKKESTAYKQAEASRAALQRKNQADGNPTQPRPTMLTPQEFSKKRQERDMQEALHRREQAAKHMENQRRLMNQRVAQAQQAQQAQQGGQNGGPNQQRPGSSSNSAMQAPMQPNTQGQSQQAGMNGQMPQQGRAPLPMATRNGHLAVPGVGSQGIPQAQMRPNGTAMSAQDMQRYAQANAQARSGQYNSQQQYQMQNPSMQSPGAGGINTQQQMHSNGAMLAHLQQQMNGNGQHQATPQMSSSPSMPPPPTPQQSQGYPQQLSSGVVPALMALKTQIRTKWPNYTEEQVTAMATEMLKSQSQSQSTSQAARQSAMNAAAGINGPNTGANMQAYQQAAAYQNANAYAANSDPSMAQQQMPQQQAGQGQPRNAGQQNYAAAIHRRQMEQMRMQQSPTGAHASLHNSGSPSLAHASPAMSHATPGSPYATPGQMPRPPSRSASTGPMQRLGSSGSMTQGVGSPGQPGQQTQGSPRGVGVAGR